MVKRYLSIFAIILMLTGTMTFATGFQTIKDLPASKEVLGFYTNKEYVAYDGKTFKVDGSYNTVVNNSNEISMVAPFWFRLDKSGAGNIEYHKYGFETQQVEEEISKTVKQLKSKNVKVLALVHNMLYDDSSISGKELAHQMLSNESHRTNFIDRLEKILIKYNMDGVNIDIEGVYKSDRNNYTQFIRALKETLGSKGYIVTVSVPAKASDSPNNSYSYPFDYNGIGKYADRVAIMTYDEHGAWEGSGPGPIASILWQEIIVKYAVTQMSPDKILLGVPTYGFDWTKEKSWPKYSSYQMSKNTADQHGINILWSDQYKVPYFKYNLQSQNHEVWFEDARSFKEKLNLMYKYNLKGIAIWRLGMEDPEVWKVISSEMDVSKLNGSKVTIMNEGKQVYSQEDCIMVEFEPTELPANFTVEIANSAGVKSIQNFAINEQTSVKQIFLSNLEDDWYKIKIIENKNGQNYELAQDEIGINCFDDIKEHWAKNQIISLYKEGYINGRTLNSYAPDDGLTRAEFIALLARTLNITQPSSGFVTKFKDNNFYQHWAQNIIMAMEENGYIAGFKNSKGQYIINPDKEITRAEMITLLYNVMNSQEKYEGYSNFTDIQGHWAEKPIRVLEKMNLVSGIKPGKFGPDQTCTRAQAAVVIQRYLKYINKANQ